MRLTHPSIKKRRVIVWWVACVCVHHAKGQALQSYCLLHLHRRHIACISVTVTITCALLIMCLLSSVARFDPRLSPPTSRHEVSRPGTFPSSSCACSRRYLARGGFDAPAENSTMSSTCQHHMSNSCPASHESLHRWVLNACSWCLACLTCQVPLRSSFWFSLNDGSLDAPCEDATFSIRQEPAADRLLSWWSARAARPHCACCQDRRLPFTSTLLYSTLLMVLACRLWRHNMITHHLSTTLVHTTLSAQCILTPRLCTHVCPTHNSLTHTRFPTHVLDTQHFCTHSCPTPLFHPQHFHTHDFSHTTFTRNFFTHLTSTRISCTHRSFTISFLFPASPIPFSIIFTFLWPLIGRNWHVGISGPLIPHPIRGCCSSGRTKF